MRFYNSTATCSILASLPGNLRSLKVSVLVGKIWTKLDQLLNCDQGSWDGLGPNSSLRRSKEYQPPSVSTRFGRKYIGQPSKSVKDGCPRPATPDCDGNISNSITVVPMELFYIGHWRLKKIKSVSFHHRMSPYLTSPSDSALLT